jgi:hypothetical protein
MYVFLLNYIKLFYFLFFKTCISLNSVTICFYGCVAMLFFMFLNYFNIKNNFLKIRIKYLQPVSSEPLKP